MKKRFLAILLTMAMVMSLLPISVFASENIEAKIGSTEYAHAADAFEALNTNGAKTMDLYVDYSAPVVLRKVSVGITLTINLINNAQFTSEVTAQTTDDIQYTLEKQYSDGKVTINATAKQIANVDAEWWRPQDQAKNTTLSYTLKEAEGAQVKMICDVNIANTVQFITKNANRTLYNLDGSIVGSKGTNFPVNLNLSGYSIVSSNPIVFLTQSKTDSYLYTYPIDYKITGSGKIESTADNGAIFKLTYGSTLTIDKDADGGEGTFIGDIVLESESTANINAGWFSKDVSKISGVTLPEGYGCYQDTNPATNTTMWHVTNEKPVSYVAQIGENKYETLLDACKAAKDDDTIELMAASFAENDLEALGKLNGKKVTVLGKGMDATSLTVKYSQRDQHITNCSTITFKDLAITFIHATGMPYTETLSANYDKVKINGLLSVYAGKSVLKDCVFTGPQNKDIDVYLFWQYTGEAELDNCTFEKPASKGAVKIYAESGYHADMTVKNCTFSDLTGTSYGCGIYASNKNNIDKPIYNLYVSGNTVPEGFVEYKPSGNGITAVNPTFEDGKYKSATFITANTDESVVKNAIEAAAVEGFVAEKNENGTYGLEEAAATAVAKIGETGYEKFSDAVSAAKAATTTEGKTITIVGTVDEAYAFAGDCSGITFLGSETGKVTAGWTVEGSQTNMSNITIDGVKFCEGGNIVFSTAAANYSGMKIQNCTFIGTGADSTPAIQIGTGTAPFDGIKIYNNTISGFSGTNSNAILFNIDNGHTDSGTVTIEKNTVTDFGYNGIQFVLAAADLVIKDNEFTCTKTDKEVLNLSKAKSTTLIGNTFTVPENYSEDDLIVWNNNAGAIVDATNNTFFKGEVELDSIDTLVPHIGGYASNKAFVGYGIAKNDSGKINGGYLCSYGKATEFPNELIAEGYEAVPYKEDNGIYVYQIQEKTAEPVAQVTDSEGKPVGENDGKYETLAAAIAAAQDGDTITLLEDVTLKEWNIFGTDGVTLDLNGKTITASDGGGICFNRAKSILVKNGKIVGTGSGANLYDIMHEPQGYAYIHLYEAAEVEFNDVNFEFVDNVSAGRAIQNDNSTLKFVNHCELTFAVLDANRDFYGTAIYANGATEITDSTVSGSANVFVEANNHPDDSFKVTNSTINLNTKNQFGRNVPIQLIDSDVTVVTNGTGFAFAPITMTKTETGTACKLDITADLHGFSNASMDIGSGCTLNVNAGYLGLNVQGNSVFRAGSTVNAVGGGTSAPAHYQDISISVCGATNTLTIEKGANVTVDGKISSGWGSTTNSTHGNIIINDGKYETVIQQGNDTDTTTRISLTGGIYTNKPNDAYVAEGYKCVENTDEATKADYPWMIAENKVAAIGDDTYPTLQAAIDAAIPGDTVKLLEDIALTEELVIEKKNGDEGNKNFILDLAGKGITCTGEATISVANTGALTVKDSVTGGAIAAVNVDGGMLTVKSGTVNGINARCDAKIFVEGGTVAENISVTKANVVSVTGGTIVKEFELNNCANASVTGGTFSDNVSGEKTGYIKGGKFTVGLDTKYVAEGYELKEQEVVKKEDVHTHSFGIWQSDNESTHSRFCECGETETAAHSFGAPTVSWTFPANGDVTAVYSTTCSVCGKQIIKYETALLTDDSDATKDVWSATATIGGKQYTATKEVAKSYTVSVPGGFTGGGNYAYGATVKVAPNSTGVNYDFALNGAPAAFNASSLTFKVTGNVEVTATEYVKPVEVKPVLTMAVDGSSTISKDSAGKYKVPFKISWAIEKNSGIEVVEVGYIYRYGGKDFATIDTGTVLAKGSVKTSTLKSLNGSYKCTHSFSSSYAGRYIYAVGYMTYKLNGEIHTIYTDTIGTDTANCRATLN